MFRLTTFLVIALMSYYIMLSVQLYNLYFEKKGDWHNLEDLPKFYKICWIPICSAFALFAFKRQIINASVPYMRVIAKDQDDIEKVNKRAERAGASLYKLTFYVTASVFGYIIMKDMLPWYMGGNGSMEMIFRGFPY